MSVIMTVEFDTDLTPGMLEYIDALSTVIRSTAAETEITVDETVGESTDAINLAKTRNSIQDDINDPSFLDLNDEQRAEMIRARDAITFVLQWFGQES